MFLTIAGSCKIRVRMIPLRNGPDSMKENIRKDFRIAFAALASFLALCNITLCVPAHAESSLQQLHHHVRAAVRSGEAALLGPLAPTARLNLAILLPLRNQIQLNKLLAELIDSSSPNYRQFLSVAEFTERFGPTLSDYRTVLDFAAANGFAITNTPTNRLVININGSVAQIENAFHVSMMLYQHPTESRAFYSPDREPSLDLNVPINHIAGLNNFSRPHAMVERRLLDSAASPAAGSGPGGYYLGSDMRAAYYGGTALTGAGQSVGLMEFDGYDLSDVTASFNGQSYSVAITNVLVDGASAGSDGDDVEQVLDIVQSISMAPGMTSVRVYIAPMTAATGDTDIFNQMAVDNLCKQISVSWVWGPDDPSSDEPIFEEFAAQGQNGYAASGDWEASPETYPNQYYPAEDPYITAVGGTDLTTNGAGGPWQSETAWSDSGGGPSPDGLAIPSWQAGLANSSNDASTRFRNVPDVAAEANFDNYTCSQGSCEGGWGGTSFAAPRWAGFLALVNQQAESNGNSNLGFINPAIYAIGTGPNYTADFHDITSGNNNNGNGVSYNAVTGYDLVTGWGSPNGQDLINALAGAPLSGSFTLSASAASLSILQGTGRGDTLTIKSTGGFSSATTFSVTGLPHGVIASFSINPVTPPPDGSVQSLLRLTAAENANLGTALVTVTATSGSLQQTFGFPVTVVRAIHIQKAP